MSITGISAASSAAYIQQSLIANQGTAAAQATAVQTATAAQTASPTQIGPTPDQTQQPGQVHHHHGGGGAAGQATDLTQSGTEAAAGTNILNTLV